MKGPPVWQKVGLEHCITPRHNLAVSKSSLQNPEMTNECPAPALRGQMEAG